MIEDNKRGIVYIVWGNNKKVIDQLYRSAESVHQFGYKTFLITDNDNIDKSKFSGVGVCTFGFPGLRCREILYNASPFQTTLYLDADTIIYDNIDFGFQMAEKYGVACCIAPASSAFNAADNDGIKDRIPKDLPQYNCGVIFFDKLKSRKVFETWSNYLRTYEESANNDQPYFSFACYQHLNPYILPKTWNYRHHLKFESKIFHGSLKIVHSPQEL